MATYSIVARDVATGQLGVAVQSHWFGVGTVVPWAEAGVGVVATQSMADPTYGSRGLELMRNGSSPRDALAELVDSDEGRAVRQVAMIDASGQVATHTGERCIEAAGHVVDIDLGVSCQANLMASTAVWGAMLGSYRAATTRGDDLTERLVSALEAAQAEGGDVRGKQSAALVVVAAEQPDQPGEGRIFDVRVDDHPEPIIELRRLITLQRAYRHMNLGDTAIESKRFEEALNEYGTARELAPHIGEIRFWAAVALASVGEYDDAVPMFRELFATEPFWRELVPKLVSSELMPPRAAAEVLSRTQP